MTYIKVLSVGKKYSMRESLKERLHRMLSLEKKKRALWALEDVSFSVHSGEIVGIVGNNGSGKSTLLKLIARVTEPSKGSIEVGGKVGALLEAGIGLHSELSGRDNIYFLGALLGMKKKETEAKLDQIVDFSGIASFLDDPLKKYSSGMAIRLAASVMLHLDTDILIFDEVLSIGDKRFQDQCSAKMQEVAKAGKIILCVSHHTEWMRQYWHRELFLEKGQLISDTKNSNCP